jgi:glycosyltransferase involved in cell wall biosynthesis
MLVALLPARNEEANIARVIDDLRQRVDVTLVIDDDSNDQTGRTARDLGCVVLRNDQHGGYGATLRRGLLWCQDAGASIVVTLDADGQHSADWIERCIPLATAGVDVVFGNRFSSHDLIPQTKILSNNLAWDCVKRILGRPPICEDVSCGFRLYAPRGIQSAIEASKGVYGYGFTHATCVYLHESGLRLAAIDVPAIYLESVVGTSIDEVQDFLRWLSGYPSVRRDAEHWLACLSHDHPVRCEIESWRNGETLSIIGERIGEFLRFSVGRVG